MSIAVGVGVVAISALTLKLIMDKQKKVIWPVSVVSHVVHLLVVGEVMGSNSDHFAS